MRKYFLIFIREYLIANYQKSTVILFSGFIKLLPMNVRKKKSHVYFSEFDGIADSQRAAQHLLIKSVSEACNVSYSEALTLTTPFIWSY